MESISTLKKHLYQIAYFDPVTASIGLGAGGLFLQNQANNDAKKAAKKATGNQKELIKRQTELFDKIAGIVSSHDSAGGFDPQAQIDQLGLDTAHYSSRDMGNSAAASRVLGYRPGDSEPIKRIQSIDSNYKLQYGQMANQIRRNAFADKISAYRGIDPSSLNPGIQTYGQQAQGYQGQMQPLSGLVGSMMPFMMPQQKASVATNNASGSFSKPWLWQK